MTPAACDAVLGMFRSWREALPAQRRMFAAELGASRLEPQQLAGAWHWYTIGWKDAGRWQLDDSTIKG